MRLFCPNKIFRSKVLSTHIHFETNFCIWYISDTLIVGWLKIFNCKRFSSPSSCFWSKPSLAYDIYQTLKSKCFNSKISWSSSCFRWRWEEEARLIWQRPEDDKNSRQHLHYTFLTNFAPLINLPKFASLASYFFGTSIHKAGFIWLFEHLNILVTKY